MKKVLIIGATGSIGQVTTQYFLGHSQDQLTLFSRSASRLTITDSEREQVLEGDVSNLTDLRMALTNQDAVFVALSGDLKQLVTNVVTAMQQLGPKRLVLISSMGIYNEIPASLGADGNLFHNSMLQMYRDAADIVEKSGLAYTIVRPGWFDNGSTDYEVTQKGQPFGGHNVSRVAIADLVWHAIDENQYLGASIGINRPE